MEIEVKAHIDDPVALLTKLTSLGCVLSGPKTQDDTVWVTHAGSLETFLSNSAFLRIRIQDNEKTILTAKRPKAKTGTESLVKREHEVVVSSASEARGILELLGLTEALRVKKVRQTAHYGDFEICIDEVEGLGSFIELEKMGSEDEAGAIQREMLSFLSALGVPPSSHVTKGYDILLLEAQEKLNR